MGARSIADALHGGSRTRAVVIGIGVLSGCLVAWASASCSHRSSAPAAQRAPTILVRFGATTYPPPWEAMRGRHMGVDFAVGEDGAVIAMDDGTVVSVGGIDPAEVGRGVLIEHSSIGQWVDYGHLASVHVAAGEVVRRGQVIGTAVRPGHSAGAWVSPAEWIPHVHVEVCPNPCRNRRVDALQFRPRCLSEATDGDIVYPVRC
jgi:murein DD-endopeptidase MepM/ murein hydrolase activator NlpD